MSLATTETKKSVKEYIDTLEEKQKKDVKIFLKFLRS
jgi:hypothetical protein